ncbi:hypothetical protein [Algoriphagus sp.]|uniref:hypothetical protein n=1 Tax=Algoriphagus sp. TaxID=1872435 RepID=UPI0032709F59
MKFNAGLITLRDPHSLIEIRSSSIPEGSEKRKSPADYVNKDPTIVEIGDELWMLFPNSPEVYVVGKDTYAY